MTYKNPNLKSLLATIKLKLSEIVGEKYQTSVHPTKQETIMI